MPKFTMPKFTTKRVAVYAAIGAGLTVAGIDPLASPFVFVGAFLVAYAIDLVTS